MGEGLSRSLHGPQEYAGAVLVLDTNIVLDLLVFQDPSTRRLHADLVCAAALWITTHAMRAEFERVLGYPKIDARLRTQGLTATRLLAHFDALSGIREVPDRAAVRCSDRDDQIFVDLVVAHGACLLSKDQALLRLRRSLSAAGASVRSEHG